MNATWKSPKPRLRVRATVKRQPTIPVLVDIVESTFFPESTRLAKLRLRHWHHCDFAQHYRKRAISVGIYRVARQLRKQGFPLHTALSVLANVVRG